MNQHIEVIHRVSNQLLGTTTEGEIFQIMNDAIKEILPGVYFVITKLKPEDMNFRIIHSYGFDKYITTISTLLGKDPYKIDFPFKDLSEDKLKGYESSRLYHFKDGLYDITNGMFNKTICNTIEKILGIKEVIAISFNVDENRYGGATFFIPKSSFKSESINQEQELTIETIAYQITFALNRLRYIESIKKDEELILSQNKFKQLINELNDIVWTANGDGTGLIDLSNSFKKFYGYDSEDFSKNPSLWLDLVHPEDIEIAKKASTVLINTGFWECEYRIVRPDETIIWLHDRKSILFDVNKKPIQMGGVASDITEKKLLEEQIRIKEFALDNSPIAIGIADLNGKITYINNFFLELFKYNIKTDVLGKHISEFSFTNKPQQLLNTLLEGDISIQEGKLKCKDETSLESIISTSILFSNNKPLCIIAVFVDITERKVIERKIIESELKLDLLNKEKDKFFSIIAHDLKSPLNGILGLLEILANEYDEYSDEERLKIIQSSYSASKKAFNLLSDLLEWARIQNQQVVIKKEVVNLNDIIKSNIELYINNAFEKKILVKNNIDEHILLSIDINSMNTVVRNLFVNAIKFTSNGGCIEFDALQINNMIEFRIKDTGIGMSEETLNKLFKLDENITMLGTNKEKGTGLGLLICNDLAKKNDWGITIESKLKEGTTFKILIPL